MAITDPPVTAAEIYADLNADGIAKSPPKPDMRKWGTWVENGFLDLGHRTSDLEAATAYATLLKGTWTSGADGGLMLLAGAGDGQRAEVADSDTGTHLQATATGYDGAEVANAGEYSFNFGWSRWVWIGPTGLAGLSARVAALEIITIDSLSVDGGAIYELGQSITPTITWTLGGTGTPTAETIDGQALDPAARSYTAAAPINEDRTYTLTVTDASDREVSKPVTIDFRNRVFWGAADAETLDSAGVIGLAASALATARGRTMTITPAGEQFIYYAWPAAWGAAPNVTAFGFPTDVVTETVSVTTAAGATLDYLVARLAEAQSNPVPIVVS